MKSRLFYACTILLFVGTCGIASATIISDPLDIDFRSDAWAGADGVNPYTVGYSGFSVTATSNGDDDYNLYQDAIDGLGVTKDENDEVDDYERILIEFSSAQSLDGVWITDLFAAPDGNNSTYGEIGRVNLYQSPGNLAGTFTFTGSQADQGNGEIYVDFGGLDVWRAFFFVINDNDPYYGGVNGSPNNEFSIAGINTAPVPEPATMLLFGTGLVGLVGSRLRKKK